MGIPQSGFILPWGYTHTHTHTHTHTPVGSSKNTGCSDSMRYCG